MGDVRAVLDTAPLLALACDAEHRLGTRAQRFVKRALRDGSRLAIPVVCLFEVAQLEERGRVNLRLPFHDWCELLAESPAFHVLQLDIAQVVEARALPALRDPFDRIIAAAAVALGVPLISPDARIAESGRVTVVW